MARGLRGQHGHPGAGVSDVSGPDELSQGAEVQGLVNAGVKDVSIRASRNTDSGDVTFHAMLPINCFAAYSGEVARMGVTGAGRKVLLDRVAGMLRRELVAQAEMICGVAEELRLLRHIERMVRIGRVMGPVLDELSLEDQPALTVLACLEKLDAHRKVRT